jgi:O-succinylhomoserine sulfhydrylase
MTMTDKESPEALHPDTLAVRAAVARSQYGENSEALYLTSGYVQPSAEVAARRFNGDEGGQRGGDFDIVRDGRHPHDVHGTAEER